jgi:hypothetical protein
LPTPAAFCSLARISRVCRCRSEAIWVWRAHLRRLPPGQQLGVNVLGLLTGLAVAAASAYLLGGVPL